MGLNLKGVNVKGIRIIGSEFLEPTQIPNCVSWFKWQTGITESPAGKLSTWVSQVVGQPHCGNISGTRQLNYDSATGRIWGDGVDDYCYCLQTANPLHQEYWFVITRSQLADNSNADYFSWLRQTDAADGDIIRFAAYSQGQIARFLAGGTGLPLQTNVCMPVFPGKAVVVQRSTPAGVNQPILVNGVEPGYIIKNNYSTFQTSNVCERQYILGRGGNSGGVPVNPSTVFDGYLYEWCWFSRHLTALERTKLSNYFKQKHAIL
jgi:hypothetical protein